MGFDKENTETAVGARIHTATTHPDSSGFFRCRLLNMNRSI